MTASLELCCELYELSGWWDTQMGYLDGKAEPEIMAGLYSGKIPAYDEGYLLRKLPARIPSKHYSGKQAQLWLRKDAWPETRYFAWYFVLIDVMVVADAGESADTPEDALCKLAIELFKQGILKREAGDE